MAKNKTDETGKLNITSDAFILQLYSNYRPLILTVAKQNRLNELTAEDLIQYTMTKLIENKAYIQSLPDDSRDAYVLAAAKSASALYLSEKSSKVTPNPQEPDVDDDGIPEFCDVSRADMKSALREMPEKLREVLQYKYILELSNAEISKVLSISEKSVSTYLSRARQFIINYSNKKAKRSLKHNEKPQNAI